MIPEEGLDEEELRLDPGFADRFERGDRPACQLYLVSPPTSSGETK